MRTKSWSFLFIILFLLVPFAALSDDGEEGSFEFTGAIQTLPPAGLVGDWGVAGTAVHVTALTRIEQEDGAIAVGAVVEVQGNLRMDGSVDASRIEVKRAAPAGPGPGPTPTPTPTPTPPANPPEEEFHEIRGAVQNLPSTPGFVGDWMVAGTTVHVTASTRIDQEDGVLATGAIVEVKGLAQPDGSINATRVEVERGASASSASTTNTWMLPSSAHKSGREGSFFTTDLTLSNTGTADATVKVKFLGHDRDGRQGPEGSLHLAPGATVTLNDIVGSFFGIPDDFGAVRITSNVPTLVIRSRTMTPNGNGHFGQDLEAVGRNDLITDDRARFLAGVRQDARFRTNLMLANATEKSLDVNLSLLAADGVALGSQEVHLEPLEMIQINDIGHELAGGDVRDARIRLATPTKGGAFTAAASVIDMATNDPSAVLPR